MTENPNDIPEDANAADEVLSQPEAAPSPIDRRKVPRNGRVKLTREVEAIADKKFDLVVVGGGAFGAWAAYDAAQRGLSVALFEQNDFGSGTSAHALRAAHARHRRGIFTRSPVALRRRAAERRVLMQVAPHLVQPLAMLVPRYGEGGRRAALMRVGRLAGYVAATVGMGRGLHDPDRRDRKAGVMSAARLRRTLPDLPRHRLMGAESRPTLQIVCPERLVIAVVQSAVCRGAQVLNHAEVEELVFDGDAVTGVRVLDRHTGGRFSVNARVVLNATGPDAGELLGRGDRRIDLPVVAGANELMLLTRRRLVTAGRALVLPGDAEGRELVVAPTVGGGSLIGPWTMPEGAELTSEVRAAAVAACLAAVNQACPGWRLRAQELDCLSVTRVPTFGRMDRAGEVVDHAERDGVSGLLSLVGRRYRAAHLAAAQAVDQVIQGLDLPENATRSTQAPLVGGDLPTVRALSEELGGVTSDAVDQDAMYSVRCRYGAHAPALVNAMINAKKTSSIAGTRVLAAELVYAVEFEGALTLADAVLRRVGLDCWGAAADDVQTAAAQAMGRAFGWTDAERLDQLSHLRAEIADHVLPDLPSDPPSDPLDDAPTDAPTDAPIGSSSREASDPPIDEPDNPSGAPRSVGSEHAA